jgi:hypothetical protein
MLLRAQMYLILPSWMKESCWIIEGLIDDELGYENEEKRELWHVSIDAKLISFDDENF